jgi:uncharacterized protein (TIGR03382 family)
MKVLGLFDPTEPHAYWFQRLAGEPVAIAITFLLLLGLAILFGRRRVGWLGLAVFALFLAPPLMTRAAVSSLNFPTLRQVYLPILLGAPLMSAAGLSRRLPAWSVTLAALWLVALAVQSGLSGGLRGMTHGDVVTRATASMLDGVPPNFTVVGIGDDTCGFAPSLIRSGPSVLAMPTGRSDAEPSLIATDPHTLLARVADGFDIVEEEQPPQRTPGANRGPGWITRTPPPLVSQGRQRISGATVAIVERQSEQITGLRYRFDRPLTELVFVRFHGCAMPTRPSIIDDGNPPDAR